MHTISSPSAPSHTFTHPHTQPSLLGNLWLLLPEGRVDVGLCVKVPAKGLVVPDFARPNAENKGWEYSEAFVQVLEQYKVGGGWVGGFEVFCVLRVITEYVWHPVHVITSSMWALLLTLSPTSPSNTPLPQIPPPTLPQNQFSWVFAMMEADPEANSYEPKAALPNISPEAQASEVQRLRKWLSKLPATRRPLVKTTTVLAPEAAIRALQGSMPSSYTRKMAPVELEQVQPAFLLPPVQASGFTTALAGGSFDLGDRVVNVRYVCGDGEIVFNHLGEGG